MHELLQLVIGVGGVALLMGAWCLVQQRWLAVFAPRHSDALAARRQAAPDDGNESTGGCAGCSSPDCANPSLRNKGGP
jgi:hypothetical protein